MANPTDKKVVNQNYIDNEYNNMVIEPLSLYSTMVPLLKNFNTITMRAKPDWEKCLALVGGVNG